MWRGCVHVIACGLAATVMLCSANLFAADKPAEHSVSGIVINTQSGWINLHADGEQRVTRYRIDKTDQQLVESLKGIAPVTRVHVVFKTDGDEHRLVSIKPIAPKANGVITGEVVHTHGWWVELKPKAGDPEGYACPFPPSDHPELLAQLKALKAGDWVTVAYTNDTERHRIKSLRAAPKPAAAESKKATVAPAAKPDDVSGILIERSDKWIMVKADGEEEPVRYAIDVFNKKLEQSLRSTFDACRVKLTYATEGDSRKLLTIHRQILNETGTITGDVVKVYNNFWVEVKPENGPPDAFAPGAWNNINPGFMEQLRGLKPGDSVTISYKTDFERHRITSLKVNPPPVVTTSER